MKLLFILPEFYPLTTGGISTFYQNLIPALVKEGCDVTIIHGSATYAGNSSFQYEGAQVHEMKKESFVKIKEHFSQFSLYPQLQAHLASSWAMYEQAIELGEFDIIETTDYGWGFIPWIVNNHKNVVVQFHASIGEISENDPQPNKSFEEGLCRVIESSILTNAPRLATYGKETRAKWEKRLGKDLFYQLPAYAPGMPTKKGEKSNYALVVGRLQYWKGPLTLSKAVSKINSLPPIYWLGRSTRYKNEEMVDFLNQNFSDVWGKKILHLDSKPKEETLQLQQGADFIIIPSVWDVFNFTCVEAMALGKVVICSNGAGASDIIRDGENGFIFQRDDSESLEQALKKVGLLTDNEKQRIGDQAKESITSLLNPSLIARNRMNWYQCDFSINGFGENDWVKKWISPSNEVQVISSTLDSLSLKPLVSYTMKRLGYKFQDLLHKK